MKVKLHTMTRKISQRIDINYQNTLIVTKFRARNSHKTIKSYWLNFQKQFINSPVIVFRVPPPIAFVHQSVKQLESNANPRVHRIAQPVTSFPGCPEWSREIRCIIRAPGIRKIGLIVRRTGSTVFDDPIPRSDFHAHAVVRARYACIPSSTMPAIRYSRNEILCLFCAMKKKEGGRRERERELYLLISSLLGGTVNDWLLSSFVLLLFCFFLLLSFHFSLLLLFFFFLFIRGVESKIDKGRWLYV